MQDKEKLNFMYQEQIHQRQEIKNLKKYIVEDAKNTIKTIRYLENTDESIIDLLFTIFETLYTIMATVSFMGSAIMMMFVKLSTSGLFVIIDIALCFLLLALGFYYLYRGRKCRKSQKQ